MARPPGRHTPCRRRARRTSGVWCSRAVPSAIVLAGGTAINARSMAELQELTAVQRGSTLQVDVEGR